MFILTALYFVVGLWFLTWVDIPIKLEVLEIILAILTVLLWPAFLVALAIFELKNR